MATRSISDDYYSILNVSPNAPTDEIHKAYHALSRTFHPDRLMAQTTAESEFARETFVRIKAAHGILVDPMFRFAYDQYGNSGVQYLQNCERARESRLAPQQGQLPLDTSLYNKLKALLDQEQVGQQQITLAAQLLKRAIERFRQQVEVARQRIRDSAFDFSATIEFPCAHHSQGAHCAGDVVSPLPYLELEKAQLDFTVKATNQKAAQTVLPSDERAPLQRHIFTGAFGANTEWEPSGTAGTELTLGAEYQETPSSATRYGCEATFPVTSARSKALPISLQFNSAHKFLNGTMVGAFLNGSTLSRKSWQYSFTSTRNLYSRRLLANAFPEKDVLQGGPDIRAIFGFGVKALAFEPSSFFVNLATIPKPNKLENDDENNNNKSTYAFSDPQLSVQAGLLPNPLLATIKFQEFGLPWLSFFASWSWNMSNECSKIKLMLSTDLWGHYEDNDTTTIRTSLKHDIVSGWIWLWEWEELDWTLKVPISFSDSKNAAWLFLAVGSDMHPWEDLHDAVLRGLATYMVIKVARSMTTDWIGSASAKDSRSREWDATTSDRAEDDLLSGSGTRQTNAFHSFMEKVAERKRQEETLVIRSAVVVQGKRTLTVSTLEEDVDIESFLHTRNATQHNLTNVLQFWVQHGRLRLAPLSSQEAPHYYTVGWTEEDAASDSAWSLGGLLQQEWRTVMDWLQHCCSSRGAGNAEGKHRDHVLLKIRYEHDGNVYDISLGEDDPILLPDPNALLLGPAASIQ